MTRRVAIQYVAKISQKFHGFKNREDKQQQKKKSKQTERSRKIIEKINSETNRVENTRKKKRLRTEKGRKQL